ncbi:putative DNA-binding domain-containing protein [uncultured Shewanella sp.]|uniref:HvfC family RiPP maturation protein n=1 Tax=uncultured Shewanella sp. TaxID=173975 RepID=UPI0026384614|nr:putative DNA-binding domain-containing protein [uncultured Shewanella sp.]
MSFISIQNNFMDYIRDPASPLPDGMTAERMEVYRDLFLNNISGFVSNAFPVLKSLYSSSQWRRLVQTFFKQHDCQSPFFSDIAEEFLVFLQDEYELKEQDPPFMLELAHYEWLELLVSIALDNPLQDFIEKADIALKPLCLSSSAKVAQYAYAVQHISVDYQPTEPAKTPQLFCVYRDKAHEINFLALSPLTAQVLGYLSQFESLTLAEINTWLQQTYTSMEPSYLQQGCLDLLVELSHKGIICEYKV